MKSLNEIYQNYKSPEGHGDKGTAHTYIDEYEKLLGQYRENSSVLEIGICRGESIKMWDEYFINSKVYGIDITDLYIKDLIKRTKVINIMETPADEEAEMDMDMDMGAEMGGEEMEMADEEEINLEELLAELDSMDEYDELEEAKKKKVMKKGEEEKKEMKEAINVMNTLRKELNEVNLLNAKLLYVNKIFKSKNLSESQKLNVIASFDKATTPKEAKMVYESLETTLNTVKKKSPIKESLGFASKAAGIAPKKQIVESNDVISRMQKLANIIK
jgi:hypothetical protein